MKKILLSILLLLTLMPAAQAQKMGEAKETDTNLIKAALKGWHVRIGAGVSLGGTSPMPLPAEIRRLTATTPRCAFSSRALCNASLARTGAP